MSRRPDPGVPRRRRVVSVVGSGREDHPSTASLGRALAVRGVDLLTGGGGGVMAGVSRSFFETPGRTGRVIGILPAHPDDPTRSPEGYPNPWVEIAVRTHLPGRGPAGDAPDSRNHLVVLSADVVVALPGGPGTRSEIRLAGRYGRPLLLLGWEGGGAAPVSGAWTAPDVPALLPDLDRLLGDGRQLPSARSPR